MICASKVINSSMAWGKFTARLSPPYRFTRLEESIPTSKGREEKTFPDEISPIDDSYPRASEADDFSEKYESKI